MSESFVYECALRVLFKGHGEVWRGDDSCGEVQRREGGNMLLRRTRRSAHNNHRALVNVHDDAHQSRASKSLLRMRARGKMIVKGGVCTTGCEERELCV